jgi:hypothetical protein
MNEPEYMRKLKRDAKKAKTRKEKEKVLETVKEMAESPSKTKRHRAFEILLVVLALGWATSLVFRTLRNVLYILQMTFGEKEKFRRMWETAQEAFRRAKEEEEAKEEEATRRQEEGARRRRQEEKGRRTAETKEEKQEREFLSNPFRDLFKTANTEPDVQRIYRTLARKYHPNKYITQADKNKATADFQLLANAREYLVQKKK